MRKMEEHAELEHLGSSHTIYPVQYNPALLEAFDNPQTATGYIIDIVAPEFTCLCPKTGQPDFATIEIRYAPRKLCVESKSFKLYLFSFRNEGAFHEEVTNRIARDLFDLLKPRWIEVTGKFYARGGITFHPKVTLTENTIQENEKWQNQQ